MALEDDIAAVVAADGTLTTAQGNLAIAQAADSVARAALAVSMAAAGGGPFVYDSGTVTYIAASEGGAISVTPATVVPSP